ncbi:MAG: hypothetical protein GTO41_26350 [Burkholderiales bacterium]|nr:hypothetical protein [Burkholderiales bacterium]
MRKTDNLHRVVTRSQLLRWFLVCGLVAAAGFWLLMSAITRYLDSLERLAESDPVIAAQRVSFVIQVVFVSSIVFAVLIGLYLGWYGYRAVKSECFPPPGSWLIEGRPIYRGRKARRLGWLQIVLGIIMAVLACGVVYRTWALLP